jgi:hypothetical protein
VNITARDSVIFRPDSKKQTSARYVSLFALVG